MSAQNSIMPFKIMDTFVPAPHAQVCHDIWITKNEHEVIKVTCGEPAKAQTCDIDLWHHCEDGTSRSNSAELFR